jgi:hypothetical protein
MIHRFGNEYIHKNFPKTDFIIKCSVLDDENINEEASNEFREETTSMKEERESLSNKEREGLSTENDKGDPNGKDDDTPDISSAKDDDDISERLDRGETLEFTMEKKTEKYLRDVPIVIKRDGKQQKVNKNDDTIKDLDSNEKDKDIYNAAFSAVCFLFIALMALISFQKYRNSKSSVGGLLGKSN